MNQLIKKIALDAMNQSNPVKLYEAYVITAPPNISIRLRGDSSLVIPKEIIEIAHHLKKHKHEVVIPELVIYTDSSGSHSHTFSGSTNSSGGHSHTVTGDTNTEEGHKHTITGNTNDNGGHTHNVTGSIAENGSHNHKVVLRERKVNTSEQDDTLNVGDRVMVAALQGGQSFFIIDRIMG